MKNESDLALLYGYLHGELTAEEAAHCEERLRTEETFANTLISLAQEEAGLQKWAAERESSRSHLAELKRGGLHRFDFRSFFLAVSLAIFPPFLLAWVAWLRSDTGLGLVAWCSAMHQVLDQTAGAVGAASTCCWLGVWHAGWLRHPALAALGSAGTMAATVWVGQAVVTQRVTDDQSRLAKLFQSETWVSYDSAYYWPADLEPLVQHLPQEPTEEEIRQELTTLRSAGFSAIYLHESRAALRDVPRLAREAGFRGVVMAIRIGDPKRLSSREVLDQIDAAASASRWVDAYCFGELTAREVDLGELKRSLATIRLKTKRPVTTSFLDDEYFGRRGAALRELADFTIRGLHHQWDTQPSVAAAIERVERAYESFQQDEAPGLLTFVGFPSAGSHEWSDASQADFFRAVKGKLRAPLGTNCVYYTSFDLPWSRRYGEVTKGRGHEGRFGLFATEVQDNKRELSFRAKPSIREIFNKAGK